MMVFGCLKTKDLKQHQIFKFPISLNFTYPLKKKLFPQNTQESTKSLHKSPKRRYVK